MNAFPNPEAVVVDPVKLTGYLLSLSHAKGSGKAKWFRRIGFDESTRGEFSLELRRMPIDGVLTEIIDSPYGTKYVVEGTLLGPLGGGMVRSVWQVNRGFTIPRLIAAYPIDVEEAHDD